MPSYEEVHEQCLDELVKVTRGLQLPITGDQVQARRLPWSTMGDGTVVIHQGITWFPHEETESAGTNVREDIGYGCGCAIILPADHGTRDNLGKIPYCRARIRRRFIHQRLDNVTLDGGHYLTTKVSHLQINQPREAHAYEVSLLLIRCWMREPRG
jgi:hypothetical protein